ncbi:hypothetical protein [Occallatibacter riparius]|uniref:Uncharacterized protein n=1 Tax=Occallatibacter riparius TaxID=1002689 RepID=A0A9J7BKX0_9BACT|nr:hypothetical protein [Occallatibacter riparius]UWZ83089.1 hypothetical protein MOP44_21270 [Occallatibacter riparius]
MTGENGYTSDVNVAVGTLPFGVSVSPASALLRPGDSQKFTFTAAPYIAASTAAVTIDGAGTVGKKSTTLSLDLSPFAGNIGRTRTGYVRTDAVLPFTVVFDSGTNRFFMSDAGSSQVFVIDAATHKLLRSIVVPGAYGMDVTPDHSTLYVGTQEIGDIYAIDPVAMAIKHRYVAAQIGATGYPTYSVRVLANGDLALLGGSGGDRTIVGYNSFAIWNPKDNVLESRYDPAPAGCDLNAVFDFEVTGDRRRVVISNGPTLCALDPVSGQMTSSGTYVSGLAVTPDGKSLLVLQAGNPAQLLVLDAVTLAETGSFPVKTDAGAMMVVSPDSKTVFIAPQLLGGIVRAYDLGSGSQAGWLPDLSLGGSSVLGTWISAIDNSGQLAGVMVEGIGILDTAAMRTGAEGTASVADYVDPPAGALEGGTVVDNSFFHVANFAAVYFGQKQAAIGGVPSHVTATTPPGQPGPVDVVTLLTDGGMQYLPYAFSYGPSVLQITPDSAAAEGGGAAVVYGFGFGPRTTPPNQIPANLQIEVNGKPAPITAYTDNPYHVSSAPWQIQSFSFTLPAGTAGTDADIKITSDAGSVELSGGLHYLPATQPVTLSGTASLAQGLYDPKRDVYYFTDASQIRVYSRSSGAWLPSISVPGAATGRAHRLWGIALSPDGSKLAVSDAGAGMIYLLHPDSPGSVQSFVFNHPYFAGGPSDSGTALPAGIAVSDSGMIYFAAAVNHEGFDSFYKIDSTSGAVTDYRILGDLRPFYKVAILSDNSRVFFNDMGGLFTVDTATDAVTWSANGAECCGGDYELALSADQKTLAAGSYLFDTNLSAKSYLTLNDAEMMVVDYVYGAQLSGDGTLLFQPGTNGIDVFDGRLGKLLTRIALPVELSQNYDALVGDGKDNILLAITGKTGTGIAIVDLSAIKEPAPLPYTASVSSGMQPRTSGRPVAPVGTARAIRPSPRIGSKTGIHHVWNEVAAPRF